MLSARRKIMPYHLHPSQPKLITTVTNTSPQSRSSNYYGSSRSHRSSFIYLLFTVFVNLNALSLLPPKFDGQLRRKEIKAQSYGRNIKCSKKVIKRKLNRTNGKGENGVLQLQQHCAFFLIILLVILTMSFGDADGIIEKSRSSSTRQKNNNVPSIAVNAGIENRVHGFKRNTLLGRMTSLGIYYILKIININI